MCTPPRCHCLHDLLHPCQEGARIEWLSEKLHPVFLQSVIAVVCRIINMRCHEDHLESGLFSASFRANSGPVIFGMATSDMTRSTSLRCSREPITRAVHACAQDPVSAVLQYLHGHFADIIVILDHKDPRQSGATAGGGRLCILSRVYRMWRERISEKPSLSLLRFPPRYARCFA